MMRLFVREPGGTKPLYLGFSQISDTLADEFIKNEKEQLNSYEIIKSQKDNKLLTNEWIIDRIEMCAEDYDLHKDLTQKTLNLHDANDSYKLIIEALQYLSEFEFCENFNSFASLEDKPPQLLLIYKENYEQYIFRVLKNSVEYSIQKIQKLKTVNGNYKCTVFGN